MRHYAKEHTLVRLLDADAKTGKSLQYLIDQRSILVLGVPAIGAKFEGKKQ